MSVLGTLTAETFTELGARFAAHSVAHEPTWTWAEPEPAADAFAPLTGYLRASPLLLPPDLSGLEGTTSDGALDADPSADAVDDSAALDAARPPSRLQLYIVHSSSYGVPVLLLQGYDADGALWLPASIRAYLVARGRSASLSAGDISQMEHPVLRKPCCCIDPCNTASIMRALLGAAAGGGGGGGGIGGGDTAEQSVAELDYLTAWWSVLAPAVGVRMRAAEWVGPASSAVTVGRGSGPGGSPAGSPPPDPPPSPAGPSDGPPDGPPAPDLLLIDSLLPPRLGRVLEIEDESFPACERLGGPLMQQQVALRTSGMLLAQAGSTLAGYVLFARTGGAGIITKLAVSSAFRKRGIGSALLRRGIAELEKPGRRPPPSEVMLHLDPAREKAKRLYESFGFRQREYLPKYYADERDALLMVREGGAP